MSHRPIKITFTFDGSGVCHDPANPTHLDGLLAWALSIYHTQGDPPERDQAPIDIPLPLEKWLCPEPKCWGWMASALFPDGPTAETLFHRRRKMQVDRLEQTSGTVNTQIGTMKEWNVPVPVLLCRRLVGFAVGDRKRVDQILRKHIRYVGRERARGYGRVLSVSVEWTDANWSMSRDGLCQRYLPSKDGTRLVRPRAPYWNVIDRVPHRDVGEEVPGWADLS